MTQLILPGDANSIGNAFGGRIMEWIDICAGVAARRHAGMVAVTASIDSLQFHHAIKLGSVVVMKGRVNRSWRSSMEIGVRVDFEEECASVPKHAASAFLTFVALDEKGRPHPVPAIDPRTDEDRRRFEDASRRRMIRLRDRQQVHNREGTSR